MERTERSEAVSKSSGPRESTAERPNRGMSSTIVAAIVIENMRVIEGYSGRQK